jgi:hypothetical protein
MPRTSRLPAVLGIAGLAASAVALAVAPALMPVGYSWLSHTTSESAAQGVAGGWLARSGFGLFGVAVLIVAGVRHRAWGRLGTGLHIGFGGLMLGAAAFSTRSWQAGVAYDRTEDTLHSVAATAMGFAFALGVAAVMLRARQPRRRPLDVVAVLASVLVPVAMSTLPDLAGGWQRLMFLVAYAWYVTEAVAALPAGRPGRSDCSRLPA